MLARNSADAVKPPKVERKQMSVLDTDATADLIEAARETSLFVPNLAPTLGDCASAGSIRSQRSNPPASSPTSGSTCE